MLKKYQSSLTLTVFFTLLILYIINSNTIINEFLNYTNIFITKLLPTTFIIFIFSNIFIEYKIIEKLNKIFKEKTPIIYIIIMSMISGFPSGAKYIKELLNKNYITEQTANYLIYFTHFPNPIFILGTVYKIINNNILTYIMYLSLIISNLLLMIIIKRPKQQVKITTTSKEKDFSTIISESIISSLKTSILIYGTSIFFYLITIIINKYLNLNQTTYILLNSIFDLTFTITLSSLITNTPNRCLFLITLISISTLSIHMQTKSILSDTNVKYSNFLKGRIISTIFAIIIFYILRSLLDILY